MTIGETQPLEAGQPIPQMGNSPEVADTIFRLRQGDDSSPIRTDRGYAVLSVKRFSRRIPGRWRKCTIRFCPITATIKPWSWPSRRPQDLARRAKGGEDLAKSAKSMGLDEKASDCSRTHRDNHRRRHRRCNFGCLHVAGRPDRRRRSFWAQTGWSIAWSITSSQIPTTWPSSGRTSPQQLLDAAARNGLRSLPHGIGQSHETGRHTAHQCRKLEAHHHIRNFLRRCEKGKHGHSKRCDFVISLGTPISRLAACSTPFRRMAFPGGPSSVKNMGQAPR